MNYSFRRMNHNDLEGVWALIEHLKKEGAEVTFAEIAAKEEAMQWIDNPAHLTYVAVEDNQPDVVFALIRGRRELSSEKTHAAFLTAATLPLVRGTGLAAELTQYALCEMQKEGVNIVRIYVYSDNNASLAAVRKLGFIHAGTVLRHHKNLKTGEYVDDLIFHKLLDDPC
jgi:RimJ/RimL family protein N-acetyltransferase